jgi:hypothetical protein
MGVDAVAAGPVDSRSVEQVARHVLQPEAASQMVQNEFLYPRTLAPLCAAVDGRSVPAAR